VFEEGACIACEGHKKKNAEKELRDERKVITYTNGAGCAQD